MKLMLRINILRIKLEGSHSGQLHEFRKLDPFADSQVQILYPPQSRSVKIMRFEFSAGGVVFNKTSNGIDILLCQHSQHHGWGFPKGLIGDKKEKETKEETALREVEEETGARGEILEELEPVTYWYVFEGEKVKKTVYYYLMKFIGGDITKHDFEMENVEWVKKDKVIERLTFNADKKVYEKALPIIMKLMANV